MGYFSNGTEGEIYQAEYCEQCIHQGQNLMEGCAVWDLHLFYNYDKDDKVPKLLNRLIPRDKDGRNLKCLMYKEVDCDCNEDYKQPYID